MSRPLFWFVFLSLILFIDKGGVGLLYIYIEWCLQYYTLLHLMLLFPPLRGFNTIDSLCSLGTDRIGNTASNISAIVACIPLAVRTWSYCTKELGLVLLPCCSLPMDVSSGSTILTLSKYTTILSRVTVTKEGVRMVIGFIGYLQVVTTNNYNTVTDFHNTKQSSLLSSVYLH
jgi:hypothetical protein